MNLNLSIHENREKHDSEVLDLVDAIHEMIEKLKNSKDPEERKRASKLYTKAGPFIRALHNMTLIENLEEGVDGRPESIRVRDKINSLKIPFLSKIVHWITDNVPPFSQLAKIEQAVAKFANNKLTKFSQ